MSSPSSSTAISAYIESLARSNIHAINIRDFSPTSPLFQHKTSNWKSEARTASQNTELPLSEYIQSLQAFIAKYPDFQIRIVDLHVSVDEKNGFAEMFLRTETTGNPVGLYKRSVTSVVYRRVDGQWLSAGHRAVPGSEVGGGE